MTKGRVRGNIYKGCRCEQCGERPSTKTGGGRQSKNSHPVLHPIDFCVYHTR